MRFFKLSRELGAFNPIFNSFRQRSSTEISRLFVRVVSNKWFSARSRFKYVYIYISIYIYMYILKLVVYSVTIVYSRRIVYPRRRRRRVRLNCPEISAKTLKTLVEISPIFKIDRPSCVVPWIFEISLTFRRASAQRGKYRNRSLRTRDFARRPSYYWSSNYLYLYT